MHEFDSLKTYLEVCDQIEKAKRYLKQGQRAHEAKSIRKGGQGSGNVSHAGRPGHVGGSAPGNYTKRENEVRTLFKDNINDIGVGSSFNKRPIDEEDIYKHNIVIHDIIDQDIQGIKPIFAKINNLKKKGHTALLSGKYPNGGEDDDDYHNEILIPIENLLLVAEEWVDDLNYWLAVDTKKRERSIVDE